MPDDLELMKQTFYKYQGTGNDFVLFDNRDGSLQLSQQEIALLCHRRFGIGADGLMLLERGQDVDFHMVYYNSDGNASTMCGNGGRCIAAFARDIGVTGEKAVFSAIDGLHEVEHLAGAVVSLRMQDVTGMVEQEGGIVLDTGSPHYIKWVEDVQSADVSAEGRRIRNLAAFQPGGLNVNFVQRYEDALWVRTYERGVEDETYSCGTGVTAAAIASTGAATGAFKVPIRTMGGNLEVAFTKDSAGTARDVFLIGPATFVFEGTIELSV